MTFSIVAHDPADGSWGVAVASKFLAVGALVPWGRAGVGAVATQAHANLSYGPRGLALLAEGHAAEDVVRALVRDDPAREERQVGVVDREGRGASYTGSECFAWAGGVAGDDFAAQGNILAGPEVMDAMTAAFAEPGPLAGRLLAALRAGDAAGGDRRGRQSAALRVWRAGAAYGGELDMAVDLRADDHPDPVAEVERLLGLHELTFGKPDPAALLPLEGAVAEEVRAALASLGFDGETGRALRAWAGIENFEERLVHGAIDPLLLDALRRAAAGS